ncbi:terpene synthase-like [Zophobas morio]|uniref:terpene synthase-like n=1 Tax=Zophobas morio TaxID=2755281 RepID=UPI0030832A38
MTAKSKADMHVRDEEILVQPILHTLQAGSENHNIAKQCVGVFNYWVKCPKDIRKKYIEIGNEFHNIFVAQDDMIDKTILRKGIPSAHLVYGIPLTVQGTIYKGTSLFQNILCQTDHSKEIALDDFIKFGIDFFTGQSMELYFINTGKCPTFEDYRVMMYKKSTSPLIWSVRLLKLFAKNVEINFSTDFCDKMGQFLQIYDDYLNLHNPKYAALRAFCDDLDEGKCNYPIIHGIQSYPDDHRLLDMLKRRPLDIESKKVFVNILESFGSFEYTRKVLEDLKDEILADAEKMNMGKNPYLERILQNLFDNFETETYYDRCD